MVGSFEECEGLGKTRITSLRSLRSPWLRTLLLSLNSKRLSASWIGNRLINYLTSTVERLVPYSTEFTVVDAIHGYGYRPFGQRGDEDTWRRLHDLIAFVSLLVEHTVGVVKALAGARDVAEECIDELDPTDHSI